ncbi:MAG: hypothetical protein WC408_04985 [Candidatus Micrarchaeia archaeon]
MAVSTFCLGFAIQRILGFGANKLPLGVLPVLWAIAGTAVFVHATNLLSYAFGYSRELVFALLFASAALFAYSLFSKPFAKKESAAWKQELSGHKRAFAFAAFVFVFVFAVLSYSTMADCGEGYCNGGWNWSDYLIHYSMISSVNAGVFPPQTPFYAGEPLSYDWFFDFAAAILAKAAGGSAVLVTSVQSALFSSLLFIASYFLANYFAKNKNAAFFAAVLVIFGGGLGYLRLYDHIVAGKAGGSIVSLVAGQSYDNSWSQDAGPFQVASVLGTGLLTHRSSTFGLPFFALVALLVLCLSGDLLSLALIGLLVGLCVPFRYFAYAAILVFFAVWAFDKLLSRRIGKQAVIRIAVISLCFALPALVGIVFMLGPLSSSNSSGVLKIEFGWLAPTSDALSFAWYYIANFGVPLILAAIGALFFKIDGKRLLILLIIALFAIPNVATLTYVKFDMNKVFQFMWIPLCILAGVALSKLPKPVVAVAIALSILSPLLIAGNFVLSHQVAMSYDQMAAASWIESNTPRGAVFATTDFINMPTDYAGRLRLITFVPYARNWGFDTAQREADLKKIYCNSAEESLATLAKYNATYLIDGQLSGPCSYAFRQSPLFCVAYQNKSQTIYKPC